MLVPFTVRSISWIHYPSQMYPLGFCPRVLHGRSRSRGKHGTRLEIDALSSGVIKHFFFQLPCIYGHLEESAGDDVPFRQLQSYFLIAHLSFLKFS